jgi:AGZA family xanthine/uracil permease-like MFS transporter
LTEGLASVAAGACGGVIQNTPYIGQPAYKAMGGRAAYTLATALVIGAAGLCGGFTHFFEWLPKAAAFPILVFIGLEIAAQAFRATPQRHFPALALAILPALAYLVLVAVDEVLPPGPATANVAELVQPLRCLANGFIVTSLLWASALAAILDSRCARSAGYLAIAAVFSLFGIIHSPLRPAAIALPQQVFAQMSAAPAIRCQSPYHWAAAYALAALLLVLLQFVHKPVAPDDL